MDNHTHLLLKVNYLDNLIRYMHSQKTSALTARLTVDTSLDMDTVESYRKRFKIIRIVIKNKKKHIVIYMLFLKEMKKWIIF